MSSVHANALADLASALVDRAKRASESRREVPVFVLPGPGCSGRPQLDPERARGGTAASVCLDSPELCECTADLHAGAFAEVVELATDF